jgi:hypothetical protein
MLKLTRTHSILAIAAALVSLLPAAIHAQKPALIQNIDEKGRNPYYELENGICGSNPSYCNIRFRTVPAGYRLVITYVSAFYSSTSTPGDVSYAYVNSGGLSQAGGYTYQVYLPAATANGGNYYTYSSSVIVYVEAGQTPALVLLNGANASGSISGYLVALSE